MKIRRKVPKPARSRSAYLVGYSCSPPALSELRQWFDREYGGPLSFNETGVETIAHHGPWQAIMAIDLSPGDSEHWQQVLQWRHPSAATIAMTSSTPQTITDSVLHAARLARGLTLLTEGTAYDVITQRYLNPSDWTDRPLDRFLFSDHLTVVQHEAEDARREWFSTRGLSKFGLDEIETFQLIGLPAHPIMDTLADIADEIWRRGRSPSVGTTFEIGRLALSVQVVRHRTLPFSGNPLPLREVRW